MDNDEANHLIVNGLRKVEGFRLEAFPRRPLSVEAMNQSKPLQLGQHATEYPRYYHE